MKKKMVADVPREVVRCIKCGETSKLTGDRYREFMVPHQKSCAKDKYYLSEMFEWVPNA